MAGDATYLLLSGIVRVTTTNSRQERVLYDLLGPGDVIAYPSLLSVLSLDLQCEAFTFCTLGRIQTKLLIEQTVGALRKQNFRLAWELMMGRW
jgi:CRP-like cAMP-binding protein